MNKAIVILVSVLIIGGISGFLFLKSNQKPSLPQNQNNSSSQSSRTIEGYQGNVLAGKAAYYIEYNRADYEKAVSDGKVIFLDFYANWCPICRAEAPELHAGFDALNNNRVVGFRVNFNDSDTDADEKALAQQFNVPYQHTKIILKSGKEIFRTGESLTKEQFLEEIDKILE